MPTPPAPVPSQGALTFLRQAALYGTLGGTTAAGLLLMEERRRRIRFLEQVVENGRRLRTSERYIHNRAGPPRDLAEYFQYTALARSSDSPSKIEKVYQATAEDTRGKKKRRRRKVNGDRSEGHVMVDAKERQSNSKAADAGGNLTRVQGAPGSLHRNAFVFESSSAKERYRTQTPRSLNFAQEPYRSRVNPKASRYPQSVLAFRSLETVPTAFCPSVVSAWKKNVREYYRISILQASRVGRPGQALQCLQKFYMNCKDNSLSNDPQLLPAQTVQTPDSVDNPGNAALSGIQDAGILMKTIASLRHASAAKVVDAFIWLFPEKGEANQECLACVARSLLSMDWYESMQPRYYEMLLHWLDAKNALTLDDVDSVCQKLVELSQGTLLDRQCYVRILLQFAVRFSLPKYSDSFIEKLPDSLTPNERLSVVPKLLNIKPDFHDPYESWYKPLAVEVRHLLQEGRLKAAAGLLRCVELPYLEPNPSGQCIEVAREISNVALKLRDEQVLAQMHSLTNFEDFSDAVCFNNMMTYAVEKRSGWKATEVLQLYRRHSTNITLSDKLYPRICGLYAKAANYQQALRAVRDIVRLPLTPQVLESCYVWLAHILRRSWMESKKLDVTLEAYESIRQDLKDGVIPLILQNTMVTICMEAGLPEKAQKYLQCTESMYHIRGDAVTLGYIMMGHASNGDWDQVDNLLQRIKNQTWTREGDELRMTDIFNSVLKIYVMTHNASESVAFARKAVAEYGITLNEYSHDMISEVFVRDHCLEKLPDWTKMLQELGCNFGPTRHTLFHMVRRFYLDYRPTHTMMLKLVVALRDAEASKLLSKDLLELVRQSIGHDLRHKKPTPISRWPHVLSSNLRAIEKIMHDLPSLHGRAGTGLGIGRPITTNNQVHGDMMLALSFNRPREAVELYRNFVAAGGQSPTAMRVAVDASMQASEGDPTDSDRFIREAEEDGLSILEAIAPQLIHGLRGERKLDLRKLHDAVVNFYNIMGINKIDVSYHVATAAANFMNCRGRPQEAIWLLRAIRHADWNKSKSLDVAAMTTLLSAYGHIFKPLAYGIRWVVKTVLRDNMPIDSTFITTLKLAAQSCCRYALRRGESEVEVARLRSRFKWLRAECLQRKQEQTLQRRRLGWGMIRRLILQVRKEHRQELEELRELRKFGTLHSMRRRRIMKRVQRRRTTLSSTRQTRRNPPSQGCSTKPPMFAHEIAETDDIQKTVGQSESPAPIGQDDSWWSQVTADKSITPAVTTDNFSDIKLDPVDWRPSEPRHTLISQVA